MCYKNLAENKKNYIKGEYMEKTRDFIKIIVAEYGKEEAREVFVNDIMEDLDKLGKKYGAEEIFHLTADEVDCEGNNIIDFLENLNFEELDSRTKEILGYLKRVLELGNRLPAEELEVIFDLAAENL